jgi:23S rRNA-/tRNA-specific pseudouridylate synthase
MEETDWRRRMNELEDRISGLERQWTEEAEPHPARAPQRAVDAPRDARSHRRRLRRVPAIRQQHPRLKMGKQLRVDAPAPVFRFLVAHLDGWHKNTVRQRIQHAACRSTVGPWTRRTMPCEWVIWSRSVTAARRVVPPRSTHGFTTLHVDDDWIAVDKRAGVLSVSTGRRRSARCSRW